MFSKKKLRVEIQNLEGEFFSGVNTLTFQDLPIEANLNFVKLPAGISGKIKIYGVSKEHMDAITTIKWHEDFIVQKAIRLFADNGEGEFLLFEGNIMSANPEYDKAPDVCIGINACAGAFFNLKSEIPPSSLPMGAPVPNVFQKICTDFGIGFVNNGVDGIAGGSIYFDQSGLFDRINAAAKAYNVYPVVYNNRVEIYPANGFSLKKWNFTPKDYIGYPTLQAMNYSIKLDHLYNVDLRDRFTISGSEVTSANATFQVIKVVYNVSTKIGGNWLMEIDGVRIKDE